MILGNYSYNLNDLLIVDSGTEISVVRVTSLLTNLSFNPSDQLLGAEDDVLNVDAAGTLCLKFGKTTIRVKALASPDTSCNLISLHDLERTGLIIDLQHRAFLNKNEEKIEDIINCRRYIYLPLSLI